MHTHHSHSGQFCQHAKNQLEEMVLKAISLNFDTMCLTEHMPRFYSEHLYPEELASNTTVTDLQNTFSAYIQEARRLQQKYSSQIEILVGFETEGMTDEYLTKVEELASQYDVDLLVGSLHHANETPIDFDMETWNQLVASSSVPEVLYCYFKRLQTVLNRLKPNVVAHYDLARLFVPDAKVIGTQAWPLITETVDAAIANGCLFELNSSAIRKGWSTPYPQRDIAAYIVAKGGRFCLSDDSHNTDQVGLNYHKVLTYVQSLGVEKLWKLRKADGQTVQVSVDLNEIQLWIDSVQPKM